MGAVPLILRAGLAGGVAGLVKSHPCFVGREAVAWIRRELRLSREEDEEVMPARASA